MFLRRMRAPLLVLIAAYSISIGGLVLMPGLDDQGNPWRMDFFHAIYFVSYMASTIGFGEIPYPFSPAQRLWTLVAIYLTVIGWLYAIGTILALIQDTTFRRAWSEWRFLITVRGIREPFYLVCGYGDSGRLLVRTLANRGQRCVVIDSKPSAIEDLRLQNLPYEVPHLCADGGDSRYLLEAGLKNPRCVALVAITNSDRVNLRIAITSKLLNPSLRVIAAARSADMMANLASFNTNHIINPFYTFADHLARALHSPTGYKLHTILTARPGTVPEQNPDPPRGAWILCGYGRFGKVLHRYLEYEGMSTVIIEPDPEGSDAPEDSIRGRGTEAVTLREADIEQAAGIVAGSDDDANNLSIIMTARDLNPNLYLVARENRHEDHLLFASANVDLVMRSAQIIVRHILSLVMTPLLDRFLRKARHQNESWAEELLARIASLTDGAAPTSWTVSIQASSAPALANTIASGQPVTLGSIERHPRDRERVLPCFALLLLRGDEEALLPEPNLDLEAEDQVLYCGTAEAAELMDWTLENTKALDYVLTGTELPEGWLWRWIEARRGRAGASSQTG